MYGEPWDTAFRLWYVMMDAAWQFFSIKIGGIPIWWFYVAILIVFLGVEFVRSYYHRNGSD